MAAQRRSVSLNTQAPASLGVISRALELRQVTAMLCSAFPDGEWTTVDRVTEGNRIAARFIFRGTHQGEFLGVAETGRRITVTGVEILCIERGIITDIWINWDALGLLQQLGAVTVATESRVS